MNNNTLTASCCLSFMEFYLIPFTVSVLCKTWWSQQSLNFVKKNIQICSQFLMLSQLSFSHNREGFWKGCDTKVWDWNNYLSICILTLHHGTMCFICCYVGYCCLNFVEFETTVLCFLVTLEHKIRFKPKYCRP